MPKGFSEREKEIIRKKLFKEGTRLFDQFGVQKTTVEEIARAVGISKGSFYSFYHSKEELFFDILEHIERKVKEKFYGEVFPAHKSYSEGFKSFIKGFFDMLETTPLFKKLNSSDLEYLMRKLPEERIKNHMKQDYAVFEEFYRTWIGKGIFRDLDFKGFTGVLKLILYLVLHQADYAPDEYRATKDIFINMLCDYVVVKQRRKK